jgi:hypothetical protein
MRLTRDFRDTVRAPAERDPAFRAALLQDAVQALLHGDSGGGCVRASAFLKAKMKEAEVW